MSTAARKARKRAGIPFQRTPKEGTPLEKRIIPMIQRKNGTTTPSNRAIRKIAEAILIRDAA